MSNQDSTIITLDKKPVGMNPLRSRSTVVALACIGAFLVLSFIVLKAGYFTEAYASTGLMFLASLSGKMLDHQRSSNPDKSTTSFKSDQQTGAPPPKA